MTWFSNPIEIPSQTPQQQPCLLCQFSCEETLNLSMYEDSFTCTKTDRNRKKRAKKTDNNIINNVTPQLCTVGWFAKTQTQEQEKIKTPKVIEMTKNKSRGLPILAIRSSSLQSTGKQIFRNGTHKYTTSGHCDFETTSTKRADAVKVHIRPQSPKLPSNPKKY